MLDPGVESLPEGFRNGLSRRQLGHQLIDTVATLHTLDIAPFEPVCETVGPHLQVERTIAQLAKATTNSK